MTQIAESLGIAPEAPKPPPSSDYVMTQLLAESKKQTRHLRAIRWMLALAWLVLLVGGIKVLA